MASEREWLSLSDPKLTTMGEGERLQKLQEFAEWLNQNLKDVNVTRIGQYIKFFERWDLEDSYFLNRANLDQAVLFTREVYELIWIWSALKQQVPPGALEKLAFMVGGDAYSRNEKGNTVARNYGFELRIASYFIKAGFYVDMSRPADTVVNFEECELHVECKRLSSVEKIPTRIKESAKQLAKRTKGSATHKRAYGLAALEVSRIVNPNQGISSGPTVEASTNGFRALLLSFETKFDPDQHFVRDNRVVAIWTQAMFPVIYPKQIYTQTTSTHTLRPPLIGDRENVFRQLQRAFEIGKTQPD